MTETKSKTTPIAVIGLGCLYPGAKNPVMLWENILARRQQFRTMPDCRLPLSEYYDRDKNAADKTYGRRAAVLDGYQFDWQAKRIPKSAYESTDIVHWLALDIAEQAIIDAGYEKSKIPKDRTGVIVGNTLTGEFTRSNTLRLRWPYVKKVFRSVAINQGLTEQEILDFEQQLEQQYKSVFAPVTEDSLAGGLSNTIAGRICNFYDFHGGGYTVDGACSSSLLAVITAATALHNQDMDMALAGGVDISLDTFELIGFAKTQALTDSDMKVFDEAGNGFIPGEGCGFVVLKRLEDAKRDQDKIYAVINGWGISSDGKGGITAPSAAGQALAISRAYERTGALPDGLDFIEGHGTGTAVGNQIELKGIASVLSQQGASAERACGITSFKSIMGHTKAAAGIGAFIKAVIAVNQRILPPTAGCTHPHPAFQNEARQLFPIITGAVKAPDKILHAGVSAMGFGGINSHVSISSHNSPFQHLQPQLKPEQLFVSNQSTEVFIFSAKTPDDLFQQLQAFGSLAAGISMAEPVDLAAENKLQPPTGLLRAALVASSPDDLLNQISELQQLIKTTATPQTLQSNSAKGLFLSYAAHRPKLGFLFPGQGSQKLNMARMLFNRFDWAQDIVNRFEAGFKLPIAQMLYRAPETAQNQTELAEWNKVLSQTEVTHAVCLLSSVLWLEFLKRLGLQPDAVAGHSLGELSACYAAGGMTLDELIAFSAKRGHAMGQLKSNGKMVSLRCAFTQAYELIQPQEARVFIANVNNPDQIVISGHSSAVDAVVATAKQAGIATHLLPVSHAFHSVYMQPAADKIRNNAIFKKNFQPGAIALYSSYLGEQVTNAIDLNAHFYEQVLSMVNYVGMVHKMAETTPLFIEVGTGSVLSGLTNTILEKHGCWPLELKPQDDRSLNTALASLYVHGFDMNWNLLYENRLIRPFVPATKRQFIINPLERPLSGITKEQLTALDRKAEPKSEKPETNQAQPAATTSVEETIIDYTAQRTGFNRESIKPHMRVLDDLNMDSIKSAELAASTALKFGVSHKLDPSRFANSTLQEIAAAIQNLIDQHSGKDSVQTKPAWVRAFKEVYVESPLAQAKNTKPASVLILSQEMKSEAITRLQQSLRQAIQTEQLMFDGLNQSEKSVTGKDIIAFIPDLKPVELANRLHALSHLADKINSLTIIVSNFPHPCIGFFASMHHEYPNLKIRVLGLADPLTVQLYLNELGQKDAFIAADYRADGKRYISQHRVIADDKFHPRAIRWAPDDVVLVTGGAKGITATCALAFAKITQVKIALVGSSKVPDDADTENSINQTLAQYQEKGLTARYYSCNITDSVAVTQLVKIVQKELGPITGLIHGAGLNSPKRLKEVTLEEALAEIAPKIIGAKNILQTLKKPLKLAAGFTSIIGVIGMPGNAWYAYANSVLNGILTKYKKQHPESETIALAYSIWSEIGMGERMGSVTVLGHMGISPISASLGVENFMKWINNTADIGQPIITSRLGKLDTWHPKPFAKPNANRFLETVIHYEPNVELIARAALSLKEDLYLKDHQFKGSYLFPTVFGLEAMAQAVAYVIGRHNLKPLEICEIKLDRPIVVDEANSLEIELHAEVIKRTEQITEIKVGISTAQSQFETDHFSAMFKLSNSQPIEQSPNLKLKEMITTPLDIVPQTDLYGWLLFQGPLFQRMDQIYKLTDTEAVFSVTGQPEAVAFQSAFSPAKAAPFILGDPFVRDAMLQSVQLSIPKDLSLPFYIQSIRLQVNKKAHSKKIIIGKINSRKEAVYFCEAVRIQNGLAIESIQGYQLKVIQERPEFPTAQDLVDLIWKQEKEIQQTLKTDLSLSGNPVLQIIIGRNETLKHSAKSARRVVERQLLERAVRQYTTVNHLLMPSSFQIEWDQNNKPYFADSERRDINLSVSHKEDIGIAIAGRNRIGCDLEHINKRTLQQWRSLFTKEWHTTFETLLQQGFDRNVAGTILWTVKEALFKATQHESSYPLIIVESETLKPLILKFKAGNLELAVYQFEIADSRYILTIVYDKKIVQEHTSGITKEENTYSYTATGPQGQELYGHRFRSLFKDVTSVGGNLSIAVFADFMGKLRELPLTPIAKDLVPQVASGKYGLITNKSQTIICDKATGLDLIEGRIWISNIIGKMNSTLDLNCDWLKVNSKGEIQRIAISYLQATWVKIENYGQVQVEPFPEYLAVHMKNMCMQQMIIKKYQPAYEYKKLEIVENKKQEFNVLSNQKQPLYVLRIQTTLEDSNIVGNVYFSNYYHWQARILDKFLYDIDKNFFSNTSDKEFMCVDSEINHLREAMPFDEIQIHLFIKEITDTSIYFYYEFFKIIEHPLLEKLAFGFNRVIYLDKNEADLKPLKMPIVIFEKIMSYVSSKQLLTNIYV